MFNTHNTFTHISNYGLLVIDITICCRRILGSEAERGQAKTTKSMDGHLSMAGHMYIYIYICIYIYIERERVL